MVQSLLHNVLKSHFTDDSALEPPKTAELQASDVQKKVVIGRGGMATVYSGRWQGQEVAVKECALANRRHTNVAKNLMETEASIHVSLSHRNIVRMFGFYYEGITLNIVAEIMETSVESLLYPGGSMSCMLTDAQRMFICKEFTW